MNCFLRAAAWITEGIACACSDSGRVEHGMELPCDAEEVQTFMKEPVRNIGRFPPHVRAACFASAIALQAGGIRYPDEGGSRTAVIATGYEPTLDVNRLFFRDYVDAGRSLGRGNLFIYTLPTSAVSEVSIHFGLRGASFYIESPTAPVAEALHVAADLVENERAANVLLLWQDAMDTLCLAASAEPAPGASAGPLGPLHRAAAGWRRPAEAIDYFTSRACGL